MVYVQAPVTNNCRWVVATTASSTRILQTGILSEHQHCQSSKRHPYIHKSPILSPCCSSPVTKKYASSNLLVLLFFFSYMVGLETVFQWMTTMETILLLTHMAVLEIFLSHITCRNSWTLAANVMWKSSFTWSYWTLFFIVCVPQ